VIVVGIGPDSNSDVDGEYYEDHVDKITIVIDSNTDSNTYVINSDSGSDVIVVGLNPTQMLTLSTMRTTGTWMWLTPTPTPT
jgi:hypothetical protein